MKDIKGVFSAINKFWANTKLRGVVQIMFWLVFFFIVAMIFRSGKINDSEIKKENKVDNSIVTSYDYEYQYKDSSTVLNILGTHFNNKESFAIDGNKYYSINNNYYNALTKEKVAINYALDEWKYDNIKNITDHNGYSNVTKYKSKEEKYEYNISKNIYNQYYGRTYENDIIMTITIKDSFISDAVINYGFGIVTIKYTNINEIDSLDLN